MLERSRAALAEERERCKTVLLQIAAFEAERETLQQEINSKSLQTTFVHSFCYVKGIAMSHLKVKFKSLVRVLQRCSSELVASKSTLWNLPTKLQTLNRSRYAHSYSFQRVFFV
jgi:DNA-binding FrmR family transcriptional regulator